MSVEHLGFVYLGQQTVDGFVHDSDASVCDVTTRVVAVPLTRAREDLQAAALRIRYPGARLVLLFEIADAPELESILELGFDDHVCGTAHLAQHGYRLSEAMNVRESLDVHRTAYHALRGFVERIAAQPDLQHVLRTAVLGISELFEIERVSVVLIREGESFGHVVMERAQELDNVVIRVDDYPELSEMMRTQEPLVISDVLEDTLLSGVRNRLEEADVSHRSAVLLPLLLRGEVVGALFLRSEREMLYVEERLLKIGSLIASITAVAIGHALEQNVLKTERTILKQAQAHNEEQIETLQEFSDFFEKAKDGFVVTDLRGGVRYANASAMRLLAPDKDTVVGIKFEDFLSEESGETFRRGLAGEDVGGHLGYVDLIVGHKDAQTSILSVTIRHLSERDAVLVSMRDVTRVRALEIELRNTKEFLENLIQSSVDAIVAADTDGRLILFNRSAERIIGYAATDVVGSLSVTKLYEKGQAQDIMRKLRSKQFGGRGRLESSPQEVLTPSGELVPVNLTAAIIYDGEREVGTVGIFTDLRERMKMEEKLHQAEEDLRRSERKAIAVELAGAAAHELNQPLTSILGYADLLRLRIADDEKLTKPLDTIFRETERMARIVRRLGQLTKYSTRPYVGQASILDLSRPTSGNDDDAPEY